MPPTLYLIDGYALAYRTYYAITKGATGSFITTRGEPTAGVFGFTSVLLRILDQERPDYLAVAFDVGRTFRDDIFPAYKGTRAKMPDELQIQIQRVRQLVDAFNIPRLEMEGYEADDILGSIAHWAVEQGLGVKIFTGDRDLLQLVNERVIVNLPGRTLAEAKDYLANDVKAYMGVPPEKIVDLKALVGDKSDNIPGVAGIGDKTAITLLETYGDLDGIYAHLDEIAAGARKRLEAGREAAYLSRTLATIVTDLQIPIDLEQARPSHFEPGRLESLFRELEFRSLIGKLKTMEQEWGKYTPHQGQQLAMFGEPEGTAPAYQPAAVVSQPAGNYILVNTPEALEALVDRLNSATQISFDTETTSTDAMQADLVGISLAVEPGWGYYIPVGHQGEGVRQLSRSTVVEALRGPMTDVRIPKVGHNLKYDFMVLALHGLRPAPLSFDTMIAEWLINPNSRNLGLKNLAWVRQDIQMEHIQELIGKGKNQITMDLVSVERAAPYAAADAEVVLRLIPELTQELEECGGTHIFTDIEMPLIEVLSDMEIAGVALDLDYLKKMSLELQIQLSEIEKEIYIACGGPFNLNSPPQLSDALFNRLKLPPPDRSKRTATGFYSTNAEVLDGLRGKHQVIDDILKYRELAKLKSTYLDALPLQVNPRTGRVHTSYSQTGSVTGRLASSEPNLQNIPIRSELGRQVRHAFVAAPGCRLLSVDYSQVELRIVAHMAQDEAMLSTFRSGEDIHTATAAAVYGVPVGSVTKDMRRRAKGINFGLLYGISAFGLMRYADLTLAESENFMQAYFRQFPGVKAYMDAMRVRAADQGYVETLEGRKRYFPGLKNQRDRNQRNREEREAINSPIQGTAADIMKIAMLRVPPALAAAGLKARMLLQVHDELVLECPEDELQTAARIVQGVMENAYPLSVPLETEARTGINWGDMSPLET